MTGREGYLLLRRALAAAGIEDPGAEARLLCERFLGLDRAGLALHGDEVVPPHKERALLAAARQREQYRPLQYILGEWEFLDLRLAVGEGVLCPREDTAVLVRTLAGRLANRPAPLGLDLCAGSGAVALGLCSLLPRASVTCVELSEAALGYLRENLGRYPQYSVTALRGDVLEPKAAAIFAPGSLDMIAANPPYVRTQELSGLQPEVRQEPALALDGGPDGLRFYRAICAHWLPLLKPGGLLAVEIGEEQGKAVEALFAAAGLRAISVQKDLAGLDRCVSGIK